MQSTHKNSAVSTLPAFLSSGLQSFSLPAESLAGSRSTLLVLREFHMLKLSGSIHPESDIAVMLDAYAVDALRQIEACPNEQLQNEVAQAYAGEFRFLVNQLSSKSMERQQYFGNDAPTLPLDHAADWVRVQCGTDGQPQFIFGLAGLRDFYRAGGCLYITGWSLEQYEAWYEKELTDRQKTHQLLSEIKQIVNKL